MKGIIIIEYRNGVKERKEYSDYFQALEEQRKLLKNKKFMENVNVLKVEAIK